MKKILHLTQTDIMSDSRIIKEIDAARNSGYQVTGIGIKCEVNRATSNLINPGDIISIALISKKFVRRPKILQHFFVFTEFLLRAFYLAVKCKPDIIHCNDTLVLPIGVLVKLFTSARLVYDAHELESNRNGLSRFLGKITLLIEKAAWYFVDALVVVSPSIETWYKANVGEKPSAVVLNSPVIEVQSGPVSTDYLRDRYGIEKGRKIFIYVGILGPGRGIDLIVEAFKNKCINSSLVFLGYGPLSDELNEIADKNSNIYVHDAVEHERVVSVVRTADVGLCLIQNVSLSDYYSLPNKLFEYCFSGIPVLASNFPDISAIVNQYRIGVCVDLNLDDVIEGIKRFERDDLASDFSVTDLVALGWEAQASRLIQLYRKVTSDDDK